MAGKVFVKSYESIRQILDAVYTYGCYDVDQILPHIVSSKKTYTNGLELLRYIYSNLTKRKNTRGKDVNYFPFDRYKNHENYLWRSYQLHSFSPQDINFYIFSLSAISSMETNDLIAPTVNGLIDFFDEAIFSNKDNQKHRNTIERHLREMMDWGMLVKDAEGNYHIPQNILEDFSDEELLLLHDLLFLFRDILPLPSLGYFLQHEIADWLRLVRENDEVKSQRTFLAKDIFLQTIIHDEILYGFCLAMEQDAKTSFISLAKGAKIIDGFSPWRLIVDWRYGRQYVWGVREDREEIYRLDKVKDIRILTECRTPPSAAQFSALDAMWCGSITKNAEERHKIILEFRVELPEDEWRIEAFSQQVKEWTAVNQGDGVWRFQSEVRDPRELLPWIRSWAPYLSVVSLDDQMLVDKLHGDWSAICEVYDKKTLFKCVEVFEKTQAVCNPHAPKNKSVATEGESEAGGAAPGLFSKFKNVYYSAIRELYYKMILENSILDAASLERVVIQRAGVQNTTLAQYDDFRAAVSHFGNSFKKVSLFQSSGGRMKPALPEGNQEVPILLSKDEKRYLHTLLQQDLVVQCLGSERTAKLAEKLRDYPPFPWKDVLLERGRSQAGTEGGKKLAGTICVLRESIEKGKCLSYENHTRKKRYVGICQPYRIMFSPKTGHFQLIAAAKQMDENEGRLVLMNVNNLFHLSPIKEKNAGTLGNVPAMLESKRTLSVELLLRNLPENGNSDVARAFMLFSTYTKQGQMADDGLYHMKVDAYTFEWEEIIQKILSLGKAVEVISPPDLRKRVAERIRKCLAESYKRDSF